MLYLFSNTKSQGVEINAIIILNKGNGYLYPQFLCQVRLFINKR